ncbi:MAG: hypothetical protein UGF45_02130 [Massilioclostridium sp.]|nr:hypothetical protein [Massilioclostridium sp.]MEE1490832.1 hypothetical protein [Massilioclostridium sp.]
MENASHGSVLVLARLIFVSRLQRMNGEPAIFLIPQLLTGMSCKKDALKSGNPRVSRSYQGTTFGFNNTAGRSDLKALVVQLPWTIVGTETAYKRGFVYWPDRTVLYFWDALPVYPPPSALFSLWSVLLKGRPTQGVAG